MNTSSPWPLTAGEIDGVMSVGGVSVEQLAEDHGTPLWVVDEADFRHRCQQYRDAFPDVDVAYASKAWCLTGLLQMATEEGLWIDVASGGELQTAYRSGAAMERVVFHGNNKSEAELRMAASLGVGRIAVDGFSELDRLERIGSDVDHLFNVWLRITPGIDAHTHEYVRTGHDDSKFGFTLSLGFADEAFEYCRDLPHVDVVGAHAHIGSQIFGTDPFIANAEVMVELLAHWRTRFGVVLGELNLGGGMGIRYNHEDHPVAVARYGDAVLAAVQRACDENEYPVPRLAIEPGRAIVAPSTVTLYRVGVVKRLPGLRTYVSVDGGMSDNIRPALYGAEHEVRIAGRTSRAPLEPFTIVGKHCESGDILRERVSLPGDLREGDLIAVAATGAYTASMASNYNRLPRPAAVLVRDGSVRELLRRETYDDVIARDVPLT